MGMSRRLSCPQGHEWALPEAGGGTIATVCPQCGEPSVHREPTSLDEDRTLALRPRFYHPSAQTPFDVTSPPLAPGATAPFPVIAGYEVLEELGRGGMGVVYKARQVALGRVVALKMLAAPLASPEALARFRTEAAAVARLHHPNIIPIFEIGTCVAGPYYTMEHADGGSLADLWAGKPQPPRIAAETVAIVAEAVHAAHEAGIVHRDLKPANVLIQRGNGEWAARNEKANGASLPTLRITDFGVARRLDEASALTQSGQMMGTPGYMAPEQAQGPSTNVGPAADVYALGVLLYEALTGGPPYRGMTALETVHLMLSEEPLPPTRLRPQLPRDLERVCLKCLNKEPGRRYGSAGALALDLHRFLAGEPVTARPVPVWERAWKWARRRPGVASLAAAVVVLAGLSLLVVTSLWRRAESAHDRARLEGQKARALAQAESDARREAQHLSARLLLERGVSLAEAGEYDSAMLWLARSLELAPESDDGLSKSVRRLLGGWGRQLHALRYCTVLPTMAEAAASRDDYDAVAALSPDHCTLATAIGRLVLVWDTATGKQVGPTCTLSSNVRELAWSPVGHMLAIGCEDGSVDLWRPSSGASRDRTVRHGAAVGVVQFSPDGHLLLTAGVDGKARLWRTATGDAVGVPITHGGEILAAAFAPDGRSIMTGSSDGNAKLSDATSGRLLLGPLRHEGPVRTVAVRADGAVLATGSDDSTACLWAVADGRAIHVLREHTGPVTHVGFHPNGHSFVTAGHDHRLLIWDNGGVRARLLHQHRVYSVAFSPNGALLATGSGDHLARIWSATTGRPIGAPMPHQGNVRFVGFSAGGSSVLTASDDRTVRSWAIQQPTDGSAELIHPPSVVSLAAAREGGVILCGSSNGTVGVWDMRSAKLLRGVGAETTPLALAIRPDGRTFLTGGWDCQVRTWETATGRPVGKPLPHPDHVRAVAVRPDGKLVAVGCEDKATDIYLWDLETSELVRQVAGHRRKIAALAFNPDGKVLASASWDKSARLWDVATGRPLCEPLPHQDLVQSLVFSPDGRQLYTGGDDYNVRTWEVPSGKPIGTPLRQPTKIDAVTVSPDGLLLAAAGKDGQVRLWDLPTGKLLAAPLPHRGEVHSLAFSPDGAWLFSGSWDGTARRWPVPVPSNLSTGEQWLHLAIETGKVMGPAGEFTVLGEEEYRTWARKYRALSGPAR